MIQLPLSSSSVIAFRIAIALGITYLGYIGTLKLIWMRRVVNTTAEHTETLAAHSRQMKALAKQIATAVSLLKGPEPPTALGPHLVKKKKDAIERAVRESQSILLEEDSGERFDAK